MIFDNNLEVFKFYLSFASRFTKLRFQNSNLEVLFFREDKGEKSQER